MPLTRLMFEATQTESVTRLCNWKAQKNSGMGITWDKEKRIGIVFWLK